MLKWKPASEAPWQTVMWVRNRLMEEPVLATRGYAPDGIVNPDHSLFTTVYTTHRYFPTPAGNLCCPSEWAEYLPDHKGKTWEKVANEHETTA